MKSSPQELKLEPMLLKHQCVETHLHTTTLSIGKDTPNLETQSKRKVSGSGIAPYSTPSNHHRLANAVQSRTGGIQFLSWTKQATVSLSDREKDNLRQRISIILSHHLSKQHCSRLQFHAVLAAILGPTDCEGCSRSQYLCSQDPATTE